MESRWSEKVPVEREKAIEELARGRDWANQLRDLLNKCGREGENMVGGEDLVMKILNSFTNSLKMLSNTRVESDGGKSEDSGESIKSSMQKDRRGCYKRRKFSESRTKESTTLVDDGYAWRKYGQKKILNATHPRNYYRCTHKFDQGCQATKQVQQVQDDPPKYRTTYYGDHTCRNLLKAPHLILDSISRRDDSSSSSVLLSFGSPGDALIKQDTNAFFSSFSSSVKQEAKDDLDHCHDHHITHQSASSDYLDLSPDDLTTTFDSSPHMNIMSPEGISGVEDSMVYFNDFSFV